MKFAYADPPYLGMSRRYDHKEAYIWDDEKSHIDLIDRLKQEYPDGWAVSLHTPSLPLYLKHVPNTSRICAWVKPFASFKPGVTVAYAWEPVILFGGRKRGRELPTCRDFLSENITLKKGLCGAKPLRFNQWILGLLNWQPGDQLDDLFPGTGGMAEAIQLGIHCLGGPKAKASD